VDKISEQFETNTNAGIPQQVTATNRMHINCKRTLCKYRRNHRDSWKQFRWHLTSFQKFHNCLIFCCYQMLADQLPIIWVCSASSNITQDAATYRAAWRS